MKTQPNDVVVGGAYAFPTGAVVVKAVKPKGRGWYVEYQSILDVPNGPSAKLGLEPFRRLAGVNQKEVA